MKHPLAVNNYRFAFVENQCGSLDLALNASTSFIVPKALYLARTSSSYVTQMFHNSLLNCYTKLESAYMQLLLFKPHVLPLTF